jgi:NADH dehydrogenase
LSRPRIVIVGANFAGITAAQKLPRSYDVAVLDPRPNVEFLPNIHELISGVKRAGDLSLPRTELVARAGHRFVQAAARSIDPRQREVTTASGRLQYDVLVIATGGVDAARGVGGVKEHAMAFKTVDDCQAIGARLADVAASGASLDVVIVGGGLEGVEALGEVLRRYRQRPGLRTAVVESGPRLLGEGPAALDRAVREQTLSLPTQILTRRRVVQVDARIVTLDDGRALRSDLTIWTGGARPPRLLTAAGLAEPGRWAPVRATLQSRSFDDVFVIGDAAELPEPVGKQAYHALDMGACAAGNVQRILAGQRPRPFRPADKPTLIAFGDLDTFMVLGQRALAGRPLAALKESVFQLVWARLAPPTRGRAMLEALGRLPRGVAALQGVGPRSALGLASALKVRVLH